MTADDSINTVSSIDPYAVVISAFVQSNDSDDKMSRLGLLNILYAWYQAECTSREDDDNEKNIETT